jgi:hypothetical protein
MHKINEGILIVQEIKASEDSEQYKTGSKKNK